MKRRKFVIGLGATSAAGAAAFGTGAFSSVEASRDVTVNVEGDDAAYLRIESTAGANGQYGDQADDGTFFLNFTENNDQVEGDGDGFNTEAVTGISDVFVVQNQGTNTVDLVLEPGDGSVATAIAPAGLDQDAILTIVANDEPVNEPVELGPGHEQTFSVVATVGDDVDPDPAIETDEITFIAEGDDA